MSDALFLRQWFPPGGGMDAVLCLHGSESHSGWFEQTARALENRGVAACAFDRRGWGKSAGARGCLARADDAERQTIEMAGKLRERFKRIHLVGLSWGGLLARFVSLRHPKLAESVTLIAPGICPKVRLSGTAKFRIALFALTGLDGPVRLPMKPEDFASTSRMREWVANDPLRVTTVNARFCWATVRMRQSVRRLPPGRLPARTRLLLAGNDTIIDNAATRALFPGAPISVYENAAHSLVLEAPERVAEEIIRQVRSS